MVDWNEWDETKTLPTFKFGDTIDVRLSDGRVETGRPEHFHWFRRGTDRAVVRGWRLSHSAPGIPS